MNFEWKDGKNRKISDPARRKQLLEAMIVGIFRTDMTHRMSRCLPKSVFERSCFDPSRRGEKVVLSKAALRKLNETAEFPLLEPEGHTVEMQSGQHRMFCLSELKKDLPDQWWIVTIYDDSIFSFFECI